MADLTSLEAEICEQCGEDFLQTLRNSVRKNRRDRLLGMVGNAFVLLLGVGGLIWLANGSDGSKWRTYKEYKATSKNPLWIWLSDRTMQIQSCVKPDRRGAASRKGPVFPRQPPIGG